MEVTILTIVLGIIGTAFTLVTFRNGRLSQELIKGTQEMIKGTQEMIKGTQEMIVESRESTERLIKEIHDSLQKSIEAADKRRAEDTKYLAQLISQISRP